MEKPKEQSYVEKNFDKIILWSFIAVFLLSYSYRVGQYYYDVIPWFFLAGLLSAAVYLFGILLFPLAMVYQTFFKFHLTFLPGSLSSIYMLLALAIFLLYISFRKIELNKDLNFFLIIALGVTAVASTIINRLPINFQNYQLIHYIDAIVIFLIITAFINSEKRVRYFTWILLLGIASIAFRLYGHVYTYDRSISVFENNYLARIFAFYVPFFIGMLWAERKKINKFLIFTVFAFTAQGITQLGSRATYLAVGIAMILLFVMNIHKKITWALAGMGFIFIIFFTGPQFAADIESGIGSVLGNEEDDGSVAGRKLVAEYGWNMFLEKPIEGHGLSQNRFENLMKERYNWFKSGHNSYIIIAVELGIFGLLAYVLLFLTSIYNSFRASVIFRKTNPYLSNISKGTMFGLIAIGLNQYMLNNPWIPTAFIGFGLSSALLSLAKKKKKQDLKEAKKETEARIKDKHKTKPKKK